MTAFFTCYVKKNPTLPVLTSSFPYFYVAVVWAVACFVLASWTAPWIIHQREPSAELLYKTDKPWYLFLVFGFFRLYFRHVPLLHFQHLAAVVSPQVCISVCRASMVSSCGYLPMQDGVLPLPRPNLPYNFPFRSVSDRTVIFVFKGFFAWGGRMQGLEE